MVTALLRWSDAFDHTNVVRRAAEASSPRGSTDICGFNGTVGGSGVGSTERASRDVCSGSGIGTKPISQAASSPAAAPGIAVDGCRQVEIRLLSGIHPNATARRGTAHGTDKN